MNEKPPFKRVIDVYVKDREDHPVVDAEISFLLNGQYAGKVPNSAGHGSIRLYSRDEEVSIMVASRGIHQSANLGKDVDNYIFRLPFGENFLERHIGFFAGLGIWSVSLLLAFGVGAISPLQVQLVKGTFSLGCGAIATEITGLLDIKATIGQKFLIAASGALAVFVLLYLVAPA
jgi:hypothetical protein